MSQKNTLSLPYLSWSGSLLLLLACFACRNTAPSRASAGDGPLFRIEDEATGRSGYQNARHETIIPFGKYALCMTDTFRTHAIVLTGDTQKWVVIDRAEKVLYEVFPFDNGPDYPSEGLFRIVKDGKIGYADANTYEIIIPPRFDCAFPFENGKAKVSTQCTTSTEGEHKTWQSDAWQYLNKTGELEKSSGTTSK